MVDDNKPLVVVNASGRKVASVTGDLVVVRAAVAIAHFLALCFTRVFGLIVASIGIWYLFWGIMPWFHSDTVSLWTALWDATAHGYYVWTRLDYNGDPDVNRYQKYKSTIPTGVFCKAEPSAYLPPPPSSTVINCGITGSAVAKFTDAKWEQLRGPRPVEFAQDGRATFHAPGTYLIQRTFTFERGGGHGTASVSGTIEILVNSVRRGGQPALIHGRRANDAPDTERSATQVGEAIKAIAQ